MKSFMTEVRFECAKSVHCACHTGRSFKEFAQTHITYKSIAYN